MSEPKGGRESVLHIYPLTTEHGDAQIAGNRSGLELLKECIDAVLAAKGNEGVAVAVAASFTADGEGYDLQVVVQRGDCHGPGWQGWPDPYFERRTQ